MKHRMIRVICITVVIAAGALAGCGDDVSIEATCSGCANDVPVGPAASREACAAWAQMFNCTSNDLIDVGRCAPPVATCIVGGCTEVPVCPPL